MAVTERIWLKMEMEIYERILECDSMLKVDVKKRL